MWLWILAIVAGLAMALLGSRRAVTHLSSLIAAGRIPPFFFGITLVALGTDLPEIANSIAAAVSGHGDLNVGDSIGSATTQITLVLGLLAFFVGEVEIKRSRVALVGGVTVLSLALGILLLADGHLSRADAAILILAWLLGSVALWRQGIVETPAPEESSGSRAYHGAVALVYLVGVGVGATLAVRGFAEVSERLSVPEYLISFFVASIGTSLPELFVDVTALRRGEHELAIGGIFGASMVDSTLSLAAGPLIVPTVVTASIAVRGSLIAIIGVLSATLLLSITRRHNRKNGLLLLAVYAALYPLLLLGAG